MSEANTFITDLADIAQDLDDMLKALEDASWNIAVDGSEERAAYSVIKRARLSIESIQKPEIAPTLLRTSTSA